jgi:hypothetical protein
MAKNKGETFRIATIKNRTTTFSVPSERIQKHYRTMIVVESHDCESHSIEAVIVDGDLRKFDGLWIDADLEHKAYEKEFCRRFFGTAPKFDEQGVEIPPPPDTEPESDYIMKRQPKHYIFARDIIEAVLDKKQYDYIIYVTVLPFGSF